jgi:hypothetical protein
MNDNFQTRIARPGIILAFKSGFNTVANNIYLILLPVIIDLLIWFGPHFSLENYLNPFVDQLMELPGIETPELNSAVQGLIPQLMEVIKEFNLSVVLRTYPVGVPSLSALISPTSNPIGIPINLSLTSTGGVFSSLILFAFIGIFLGSYYYQQVAVKVHQDPTKRSFGDFTKGTAQVFLLPVFMIALFIMFIIPLMLIIPVLSFISPIIGQLGLYFSLIIITWLLVPLSFTPHSIFLFKQNVMTSMMTSISVVRHSLPGSAFFLFSIFLCSMGMNYLWSVPPEDSWMLLVGIFGHAFISTALLASSYYYFLDATRFAQSIMIELRKNAPSNPL